MEEQTVWEGRPSQWVNFGYFVIGGLLCWTVLPLLMLLAAYLRVRFTQYAITSQRLRITTGVLSRRVDEIELYRVKDYTVVEPFILRLVGMGSIYVASNDVNTPSVVLSGVVNPRSIREKLRTATEARRDQKRVRVAEME